MIEVRVRHSWPGFTLDAGFTAPRGVTALFGRSGSGKTTILRAVAGLLDAEAAEVRVGGEDLSVLPAAARGVGYVFQDGRLFPHLSVAQNIDFAARFGRAVDAGTRAQIIEMLELGPLFARHP
ncbi:MAG: ATP-binding cassette domain-containing protein, partial [Pseudomonadota bacterium]